MKAAGAKLGTKARAEQARQTAEWCRRKAESTRADPRDAYENAETAKRKKQEAESLEAATEMSTQLCVLIGQLINTLESSSYKSQQRENAGQRLREARFWLKNEIQGDDHE